MMTNKSREAIAFRDYLNDEEENALNELISRCNKYDMTSYSFPEDADCYGLLYCGAVLCSALALFGMGAGSGGRDVDEILVFTAPEYRRRGYCKRLCEELNEEYEIAEVNRFAIYGNPDAEAALRALGAVHTHDECIMELKLFGEEDRYADRERYHEEFSLIEEMSLLDGVCEFKYGSCSFRLYEDRAYIYAVLVYDSYRSKGYGFKIMYTLLEYLRAEGIGSCFLEVDSSNTPAYELYKKLGFGVSERLGYYEKVCSLE